MIGSNIVDLFLFPGAQTKNRSGATHSLPRPGAQSRRQGPARPVQGHIMGLVAGSVNRPDIYALFSRGVSKASPRKANCPAVSRSALFVASPAMAFAAPFAS